MPLSFDEKCLLEKKPGFNEAKLGLYEGQQKEGFTDVFQKIDNSFNRKKKIAVLQLLRA